MVSSLLHAVFVGGDHLFDHLAAVDGLERDRARRQVAVVAADAAVLQSGVRDHLQRLVHVLANERRNLGQLDIRAERDDEGNGLAAGERRIADRVCLDDIALGIDIVLALLDLNVQVQAEGVQLLLGVLLLALLCGLVYYKTKNLLATVAGEVFGTSILGGLCAYPVAIFLMGKSAGDIAFYAYIVPFLISTGVGAVIAGILVLSLQRSGVLRSMQSSLS